MKSNIVVIGSLNIDFIIEMDKLPQEGQTVIARSVEQINGGKGANQAVTIGKLNERVSMIGKVGSDDYGNHLIEGLKLHNVNTENISKSSINTGFAFVSVDDEGRNQIAVVPGANYDLKPADIWEEREAIEQCDAVVLQLEIPIKTVEYALELAKEYGKITILNPAPATQLNESILKNVDILIPNEHELYELTGIQVNSDDQLRQAAKKLLDKGVKTIIATLGQRGCCYIDTKQLLMFPAHRVEVKDTTAAGDSFIGGFVSNFISSGSFEQAIQQAQRVAAITVTRSGSQSSIPTLEEVLSFSQ